MNEEKASIQIRIDLPAHESVCVDLVEGDYTVGRSEFSSIQIDHASLAETHCRLQVLEDGRLLVRDPDPDCVVTINGTPIDRSVLFPGQTLGIGEAEIQLEENRGQRPFTRSSDTPVSTRPRTESANPVGFKNWVCSLPTAFVYPLRNFAFTIFLSILIVAHLPLFLFAVIPIARIASILSGAIMAILAAFFMAVIQQTVQTSAEGESEMPGPPDIGLDFGEIWDILSTHLGVLIVCFGPAMLAGYLGRHYMDIPKPWTYGLWIAGAAYLPGSYMLTAVHQDTQGLNPLFVIPTVILIPLTYAVFTGVLVLFAGVIFKTWQGLEALSVWRFLNNLILNSLTLYLAVVYARILGTAYYSQRDKLNRFSR